MFYAFDLPRGFANEVNVLAFERKGERWRRCVDYSGVPCTRRSAMRQLRLNRLPDQYGSPELFVYCPECKHFSQSANGCLCGLAD
jgi:hypothetical protein